MGYFNRTSRQMQRLWRLFREEMITKSVKPVSSEALSTFQDISKQKKDIENKVLIELLKYMEKKKQFQIWQNH